MLAIDVYINDNWQIAVIDPKDDSSLIILTDLDSDNVGAIPSPEGEQIAFVSDRNGNSEIYIMNANGSNLRRVTDNPFVDYNPSWSPDGKKLAFTRWDGSKTVVHIIDADGQNETLLAEEAAKADWSPDGKHIVLEAKRDVGWGLYAIDMDTGKWEVLTWPGSSPKWSPDGKLIAFDLSSQIWAIDLERKDRVQLTNVPMPGATDPCWSSDGKKMAFSVQTFGEPHWETWIMNADGKNQRKINLKHSARPSSWVPMSLEKFAEQQAVHPSGKLTATWGRLKK